MEAFRGINDDELDGDASVEFSYELSVLSNEDGEKVLLGVLCVISDYERVLKSSRCWYWRFMSLCDY